MSSKESIACIALNGTKVLIAHRLPVGQMGDRWEFPGGKVEENEREQEAIVREMQEEFGIKVSVGSHIASAHFMHNGQDIALECYRITVPHDGIAIPYKLSEHSEYRWVDISEIEQLSFVDSDLLLYPHVVEYVKSQAAKA